MRNFRRLPPVLRVARIFALLLHLAALALLGWEVVTGYRASVPWDFDRVVFIALNLGALGGGCTWIAQAYHARTRWPAPALLPLDSWQSQLRAIALASALPVCALVSVTLVSPTYLALTIALPFTVLALLTLLVAELSLSNGQQAVS